MVGLRVLFSGFLLAVLLMVVSSLSRTPVVSACTFSLRDSVREAELIAVGTIDDFRVLPTESVTQGEELGDRIPVEIDFSVSDYIKGSGPEVLLLYQPAVEIGHEGERISRILDGRTDCGSAMVLDDQCVLLLARSDSARYQKTTPFGCSADQSDVARRADLIRQLVDEQSTSEATEPAIVSLGDVGTGPTRSGSGFLWLLAALAGSGAAMVLTGAALVARRRPS